ncbi:IS3 family transposase [Lysobacter soyae]|uniref:IS3 family transposase n=1 Tax=Lysobacter soyae TaxID=2764185 RepID=A0ABX8WLQ6_9GAMM|nr:IS3 family transposase [Lysobacter sp. CJ11]
MTTLAESFFGASKKELMKGRIYRRREIARQDVFDCIEIFHNPIRRLGSADGLSPVEFERRYSKSGTRVSRKNWSVQ